MRATVCGSVWRPCVKHYSGCCVLARMQQGALVRVVQRWWARHMHAVDSSQTSRSTKTTVHITGSVSSITLQPPSPLV